jgi:nitroimidazol reductase NimA-like FMN-containing flavoprotein (pyridoxamine 5'-phosphate oxidase superfamily)
VLIGSLMLFGLYKSISKEDEKVKKAEEMFKLIEYESIKEVKEFKLYWKEKYYDKLFK